MCKISHKLNTDTFQIIDPILACVTSYEELINGFLSVRSVRWLREKCHHLHQIWQTLLHTWGINDTYEELWISYTLFGKIYTQAVWIETCWIPRCSFKSLSKLKKMSDSAITFCSPLQTGKHVRTPSIKLIS